ncbi:PIN domain-containing protein [Clostridium botulinum]|uniref:PIN domain-containing protein n=1 Tax=Clostridium botulinum TaxID=1491 RepID=UPI003DA5D2C2
MVYIFLDTNIYIKLLTNLADNSFFQELKVLVKEKVVKLLVPEIVLLELYKQNRTVKHNFENELNKLQVNIKECCKSLWSEVREIESKISSLIIEERKDKEETWDSNYNVLLNYLTSSDVEYIEFTPRIMCNGEKRKMSGKLVRTNESSSQDAYNIECLISYLNSIEESHNTEFIICTNDIKDFSKNKKYKNGFYNLHPIFECDFKNAKCVNSLENLMKYINYGFEYIEETNVDVKAIEEFNSVCDDLGEEEYSELYGKDKSVCLENLNEIFMKKIIHTQNDLQKYREVVINDIYKLLNHCRESKKWSNRSEFKLYSWLENREEDYICMLKLSDLILIRENMNRYLKIHLE